MSGSETPGSGGDPEERVGFVSLAVGIADAGLRSVRVAIGRPLPGEHVFDVALGAVLIGGEAASRALAPVRATVGSSVSQWWRILSPPARRVTARPIEVTEELRARGRQQRVDDGAVLEHVLDILVPAVADELVRRVDLSALVQDYLDIEAIVAGLDLDSVVAAVDLDQIAARLDLDAVIDRLDLTAIVLDRVDLDAIARRVDVDAVVNRVDIDAIAARLDLQAIIERLDLPALAQQVIDEIDLPAIIRESSGSVASEAVRGVRMHSIEADEAVSKALDRVLRHRHGATPAASATSVAWDDSASGTTGQPSTGPATR
ncbi:MAG TPA: hypothetical protein VFP34_02475 [Microlunatus sp.]|nr:hypothetical protein [Microlunatus sp.]